MLLCADAFDAAFAGRPCRVLRGDGSSHLLPTWLWSGDASRSDLALFVEPCHGPTLDIGCGPGRIAGALAARGVDVLGIDTSREAVRLTRARGARALQRDVFDQGPSAPPWHHVLLADGNIGMGGDPVRLLRHASGLLHRDGAVLAEVSATGVRSGPEHLRLRVGDTISNAFPWFVVGVDDLDRIAAAAGLLVTAIRSSDDRTVATLRPRSA